MPLTKPAITAILLVLTLGWVGCDEIDAGSDRRALQTATTKFVNADYQTEYELISMTDSDRLRGTMAVRNEARMSESVLAFEMDGQKVEIVATIEEQQQTVCVKMGEFAPNCQSRRVPRNYSLVNRGDLNTLNVAVEPPRDFGSVRGDCFRIWIPSDPEVEWIECYAADGRLLYADGFGARVFLGRITKDTADLGLSVTPELDLALLEAIRILP